MAETVIWVLMTLVACVAPVGFIGWDVFKAHRKNKATRRENIWRHEDYRINVKLWELLHEDDPAWLVAMGIEPPRDVLLAQERKRKAEQMRGTTPGTVADLAALKPLTPWAMGGNTFDRTTEDLLERKLMADTNGWHAMSESLEDQIRARQQRQLAEQQMSQRYRMGTLGAAFFTDYFRGN